MRIQTPATDAELWTGDEAGRTSMHADLLVRSYRAKFMASDVAGSRKHSTSRRLRTRVVKVVLSQDVG